jgi:AAA ATPase-like protein
MPKINPFRPNYPINPAMFVGRLEELVKIEGHLLQTRAGTPTNFMITGERGIGKTSLLNYVKWAAQGTIPVNGEKLAFLVVDVDVDPSTTPLGLIRKIELGLRKQLSQTEPARHFIAEAWSFLKGVEAAGFKIGNGDAAQEDTIFDEFCYSLAAVAGRISSTTEAPALFNAQYDGILILIDEADNCGKELGLGLFLKLLLERLHRRECHNVLVGLAGLDSLSPTLTQSHPSVLRMFESLALTRLSQSEIAQAIDMCLKHSASPTGAATTIAPEARTLLASLSEGYPHFIQQFGFSAFQVDTDGFIDETDVGKGAFGDGGALEQVGDRYYRDDFFNRIQKDSYRQVLRIMADKLDGWITKKELAKRFKGSDAILANALKALRDRHIILSKPGEKGVYRLKHKGFALWIKLYHTPPSEIPKLLEPTTEPAAPAPVPKGSA